MTALVVGASAGLGRALAAALAAAGHDLVVASSDARDVEALAADLQPASRRACRWPSRSTSAASGPASSRSLAGRRGAGRPRRAAAADRLDGRGLTTAPRAGLAERLLRTNFLSVVAVVARFLPELRRRPRASVVGFGSVAAARGRRANLVYASAKRALQTYFEGLRHACAGTPVRVSFWVPGYLDTNLAFGRSTPLPRADPARLAARVVRDLGQREGVAVPSRAWRPSPLPCRWSRFLFKRLKA